MRRAISARSIESTTCVTNLVARLFSDFSSVACRSQAALGDVRNGLGLHEIRIGRGDLWGLLVNHGVAAPLASSLFTVTGPERT